MRYEELAKQIWEKSFPTAKAILDASGLAWRGGVWSGQCREKCEGFPELAYKYDTVVWGQLTTMRKSTAKVGDVIDGYTVIVNHHVPGDAHVPGTYFFFMVKEK